MAVLARISRSALCLIVLLTGCASSSSVREYLDADTAATVTVANGEWIFARERTDLAMHARDYITLTPVQNNRNGKRALYLHCQVWSTIDRRNGETVVGKDVPLSLIANDRKIALIKGLHSARELGFQKQPIALANAAAEVRWIAIDVATLRYLHQAQRLKVSTGEEADSFELWRDRHAAIEAFLQQITVR